MRDDYLGPAWADNHQIWADTVVNMLRWVARLPMALLKGTKPRYAAIGAACVHKESSVRKA